MQALIFYYVLMHLMVFIEQGIIATPINMRPQNLNATRHSHTITQEQMLSGKVNVTQRRYVSKEKSTALSQM